MDFFRSAFHAFFAKLYSKTVMKDIAVQSDVNIGEDSDHEDADFEVAQGEATEQEVSGLAHPEAGPSLIIPATPEMNLPSTSSPIRKSKRLIMKTPNLPARLNDFIVEFPSKSRIQRNTIKKIRRSRRLKSVKPASTSPSPSKTLPRSL